MNDNNVTVIIIFLCWIFLLCFMIVYAKKLLHYDWTASIALSLLLAAIVFNVWFPVQMERATLSFFVYCIVQTFSFIIVMLLFIYLTLFSINTAENKINAQSSYY